MRWYVVSTKRGLHYLRRERVGNGWTIHKSEARFWEHEYKAHRMHDNLGGGAGMRVVNEAGLTEIVAEMDRRKIEAMLRNA